MTHVTEQLDLAVHYLTPEDMSTAASLIYQAYHDDPLLQNVLGYSENSAKKYEKTLRTLVREELSLFWQDKQPLVGLYQGERLKAVACVFESEGPLQSERYWHWRLKLMLSAGFLHTHQLIEKEKVIRQAITELGNVYFLAFIAVDPHYHGQGLGRFLLRGLNDLIDSESNVNGIAVFVTQATQVPFFSSEGYQLVKPLNFNKVQGELLFKAMGDMANLENDM